MTSSIDPELLLREHAWLRRLAHSLAADPASADDLVQDTWLAALEHPPRTGGEGLRAWLAEVARNLVRGSSRRAANARARERSVARGEALPSVSESVERVAAQRQLVDAVLALEPLERDLVVLRYFEDLPPRVIASRLGLSGPTVRSRLSRALARLRERLDRSFEGGRRTWAALLVPAGERAPRQAPGAPALPLLLGALGAGAVAFVVTLRALAPASVPESGGKLVLAESEPAAVLSDPDPPAQQAPPVPASAPQPVALEATRSGSSAELAASTWTLVARFVDEHGAPLAGVRLAHSARGDEWSGESDSAGEVRIELPWPYTGHTVGDGQLWVEARGRALAMQAWYLEVKGPGEQSLGEIRMTPGGSISGRTVDEDGRPLGGAFVTATGGYAPETPPGLDEARTFGTNVLGLGPNSRVQSRTDNDGRFELDGVPATDMSAHAVAPGFLGGFSALTPVAPGARVDAGEVVLARPGPENLITGTVRDARAEPVAGVRIEYGERDPRHTDGWQASTDADGRFALQVPRERKYTLLFSRDERGQDSFVLADVPAGTLELDVRLPEERWIELVALDGTQEVVPIRELRVWDTNGVWLRATSEAQPDGRQRLLLPSAQFEIEIATPGWKNQPQGPLDPATVAERLVFPVERAAGMSGRVLADRAPAAGARVHAHPHWDGGNCGISEGFHARVYPIPFAETETDAEGRYRIPGDSSGTVTLHAELDGWARAELGPFDFVDGVEQDGLDLVLERGGTIEGRVLLAEGVEARGMVVGAGCGEAHVFLHELGADGTYRFEQLRPGDYQVLSVRPGSVDQLEGGVYQWADPADPVVWSTSVRAGEVTRFHLDLRDRIPSRLAGELRFDGQPAARWWCSLFNRESDGAYAALAGGRFDLRVPRPGPYTLGFSGTTGPARVHLHQALELAPGDNAWYRDLPTGTLTLEDVPAFERTEWEHEAPAFALRWRDDPALTWNAGLQEPPAPGTSELTIPLVPAGRVQILRRPEGTRHGTPDVSWPVVLELDLAAGTRATIALP